MSMNFAREQSLLRQRLQAAGSPELAAAKKLELGSNATFLGADAEAVGAAAADLCAAHPQMGRAQMTAFVRTLWQSRIHELRAVGIELLAARAGLLEPADLAFLEGLLKDCDADPLASRLAGDVVGALVTKNRKLWKDLKRFASASHAVMRRAAIRACRLPLLDDAESFHRFAELAEPLAGEADQALQHAIDDLLAAAAAVHLDAVREFAGKHGRKVTLPRAKVAKPKPMPAEPTVLAAKPTPARKAAKKPAAKPAAVKTAGTGPATAPAKKRAAAKKT